MRTAALFPLLLGVVVACSLSALADKRAEQQIRAEYDKTIRFTRQKNVDGLLRQMTPDFLYKTREGQILSKQAVELLMRQDFARIQEIKVRTTQIQQMQITGNTARVVTRERTVFTAPDAQGKLQRVDIRATTRDTWVKTPQGWKVKMTEVLDEQRFVDGKPQPNR
ncbi:MAG: nuclear transport factor 2 family protein [Armatimonadota bacterium]|nr:nuclear transport factor 2 family protein [bacterium]MCS7309998.1 nuclear transport factor 2 family protein [Armatimonadota bacterium]MDW8103564.1 nuclear transport factor 2 family protein [Armatimonadota bacterium]MDW8289363.1 nuclear transport factor 2 family protein [Armatimonadota bacterium]